MKKLILVGITLISLSALAQTPKSIKLNKGQTIIAKNESVVDIDLGMGKMNSNNNSQFEIKVIDENINAYILVFTPKKIKMTMEGIQSMSFDSDNPDDVNSEIGQTLAEKLNVPDTIVLEKTTGKITPLHENKSDEKPSGNSMISGTQNQNQTALDAFLIIPKDIKIGNTWKDSTTSKGITTKRNFTWVGLNHDTADIKINSTMTGTTEQEMQGMPMTISIDVTSTEMRKVNINTGMVINTSNDSDMKNTLESMGGMTMTTKMSSKTNYNN